MVDSQQPELSPEQVERTKAAIKRAVKREQTQAGIPKSEQISDEMLEFLAKVEMIDHARYPRLHKKNGISS